MTGDWLFEINLNLLFFGLVIIFILAIAVGYWFGRKFQIGSEQDSQLNTILGATLGLLGLLLAFTFSMSASRYDNRRQLVLAESNAIGTAYLRTQMLPEPYRVNIQDILRKYVDTRLEFYNAGIDPVKLQQATDLTVQMQDQIWQQAIELSKIDNRSIPIGLFIESVNEMIDIHSERLAAMKNRVPEIIIDLLIIAAVITLGLIGFSMAIVRRRNLVANLLLLFLIATILTVIIDLDRPRRGLIQVSQESMVQLQQSIK